MDLVLMRTNFREDGIFGKILTLEDKVLFATLEHAFDSGHGNGSFAPIVPNGLYRCVRGEHRLSHMIQSFTTFEITGVTGHDNILFHVGNFNRDSQGCVLLGAYIVDSMLRGSRAAFNEFLKLQNNINEFTLTVKDEK